MKDGRTDGACFEIHIYRNEQKSMCHPPVTFLCYNQDDSNYGNMPDFPKVSRSMENFSFSAIGKRKEAALEILRCEGLTKVYGSGAGQVTALNGIDLSVEKGEFVAIVWGFRFGEIHPAPYSGKRG
mgnify:CR=1 FL=1